MSKKNVTNSRFLLKIATKRGTAYRDFRDICWDYDTQSDASAGELSSELESDLTKLMRGDFETINRKLAEY